MKNLGNMTAMELNLDEMEQVNGGIDWSWLGVKKGALAGGTCFAGITAIIVCAGTGPIG